MYWNKESFGLGPMESKKDRTINNVRERNV